MQVGQTFFNRIKSRLNNRNQNWLAIVCGEPGSGKSYSGMTMGSMISHRFSARHITFSPLKFLELINSGKLQTGDVIMFDEAGVGMASREWYSIQNKLLGSVLQTFRNLNLGVIFTTPNLSFIDVQARKLFHNYFDTVAIDREHELVTLKCYDIQHNSRLDKTYYKYPKITIEEQSYAMNFLSLSKPDENLVESYEVKKEAFTRELNKKAMEKLQPKEAKPSRCPCGSNYGYMTSDGWKCRVCGALRVRAKVPSLT